MISDCGVLLNEFAIDIVFLLFVHVTAMRVKVLSLPIYDNVGVFKIHVIHYIYKEFVPWYLFRYISWSFTIFYI